MSTRVCVLASWEVDGRLPDCRNHHHIKIAEAREMTSGLGTYRRTLVGRTAFGAPVCWLLPVAEWVGPGERRIAMLTDFDYKPKRTKTGHVVFNRVER